ncbi:uncharacterized protein I303_103300 [Kwoniella dejecticola CBS 10117]|uniref:Polysaccharide lyase 14 domain-containing protein n=1 Tax=Kwoniella dejecticola CBS 10117 TaxID=1296121 RepID=A0A1A6A6C7_9TREE|nr:uncharacterized protein I303_03323 [Kwoniella dejecticola CBS 10117]OBR85612.1 hypothetical protein I303_03323 [Kwoniella dejecticola CBS 10117]
MRAHGSNRWMRTLTVISAAILVVDAVPLPQSADVSESALSLDSLSPSMSDGSSSYSPILQDQNSEYYDSAASLYADEDAQASYPIAGTTWESDAQISDLSSFSISNFSSGSQNIEVLAGSPSSSLDVSAESFTGESPGSSWDGTINSLRITYPAGSLNPGNNPRGGSTFYAHPLNMRRVHNATLEYSVFFPKDFDFVKGGKLPGLYGGYSGCAGGVDARDCFSTRMMWRENGHGELYLYAPRHRQTQRLCRSPPFSDCSTPYGLSIGRGSWTFQRGEWTNIRQDVWLNTPGRNDGGFNIWINGKLMVHANDVFFRDVTETCLASMGNSAALWSGLSPIKRDEEPDADSLDTFITEDWLSVNQDTDDQALAIRSISKSVTSSDSILSKAKRWLSSSLLSKRSPYDDGHWKGINGYPGDPGYNGGNANVKTGTPGDVYTYEFTEVVTFPTALAVATTTETETATVTVTAAPEDPPADDPARKRKRQDIPEAVITGVPSPSAPEGTDTSIPAISMDDGLTASSPEATDVDALKAPVKKPVPPKPKVPPKPVPPKPKPTVKPPVKPVVPPKPAPPPAKPTPPPAPKPVVPAPKPPAAKAPVVKPPAPVLPPPPTPPAQVPLPPPVKAPVQAPVIAPPPAPKAPTPPAPPAVKAPGLLPVPNARIASISRPHRYLNNVDCERGFVGLFFSTFFGGHTEAWASPKEQNTYFRNFRIRINS